ncbi:MAG TPA: endonuclease III [Nitrospira sp.]|nr:endonuclease III [Nitrospira sp.]HBR50923.1 endonuclease III [Nitrospira sp.]
MRQEQIHAAVRILKREIRRWEEPVVGVVAKESNRDPFLILISTLISLRTKDKTTREAGGRLFALARTPVTMLQLPLKKIEQAIYPAGFYRTKSKSIHEICRRLLDQHDGKVPDSIDELVNLPGVGRKTANLVVTIGFGKPGICVDIHVHRISNRWGYIKTKTPEESENALRRKLPKQYWITYNDLLVPYGQNLCLPVSPLCSTCKLTDLCDQVGVTRSR